jgi:hypothetical protein
MVERSIHFVGSMPGTDAAEVMRDGLRRSGRAALCMPDGEIGERGSWIMPVIEGFRTHPGFELRRDGDWSCYEKAPVFRLRRGYRLVAGDLRIGQAEQFEASYPIFRQVRDELGYTDVAFQVGLAGDLDFSLFTFGPGGAFTHRRPFAEALVREIERMHAVAGSDVIFQLELPAELVLVTKAPAVLRPAIAGLLAAGVAKLAAAAPRGARFGVHLCVGDLRHKALGRLRDARPVTLLANAIAAAWPAGRSLEYVHVPLAAGDAPAPLDGAFYAPLAGLRLPAATRFAAGFVHEERSLDELRSTLCLVEESYGGAVDVASACGFGRQNADTARACIDLASMLRTAEQPEQHSLIRRRERWSTSWGTPRWLTHAGHHPRTKDPAGNG